MLFYYGEIRDRETAEIAIQAGQTGHYVLSTIHTIDSVEVITRLRKLKLTDYDIASTVGTTISQRLLRRICPHCKREREYTDFEKEVIQKIGEKYNTKFDLEGKTTFDAVGCEKCNNSGYYDRIGIFEVLNIDDDIKKELILKKLEKEFNLDIEFLRNKLQNMQKSGKIETLKKPDDVKLIKLDKYQKATYAILNEMLNNYNAIKTYEKRLNYLPYETARYLANEIIYYSKHEKDFVLADFITQVSDKEELALYLKEVLKYDNEVVSMANFDDYLKVIEEYKKNQEIKRLKELMKKEVNQEKKALIADKIRLVKMGS